MARSFARCRPRCAAHRGPPAAAPFGKLCWWSAASDLPVRVPVAQITRLGLTPWGVATHISMQRWPRDTEKNPVKRRIHTRLINELKCPEV